MNFDEYQKAAMRTADPKYTDALPYSALAIAGEAGEFVELVKKYVFHNSINTATFVDRATPELGDILWGVAHAASALGMSLNDIAQLNITKLQARYPDGFKPRTDENNL